MNRHALLARLRLLFRRDGEERMDAEFRFHMDMAVEQYVRGGMTPEDAQRRAVIEFGGREQHRESMRDGRTLHWLESLWSDLRYAVRNLRAHPAYTLAVVLTLALGVGTTAGMFTILNAVLLRPLPFPEAQRILSLSVSKRGTDGQVTDRPGFQAWQEEARTLEAVAAYGGGQYVVHTPAGPQQIRGMPVTASYFRVFGLGPILGRVFTAEEDRRGGPPVVVISEQLWRGQFAADSSIVGATVTIDDQPATIIGVMPAAFTTPRRAQLWRPYRLAPATGEMMFYHSVVARMRPDATLESVRTELAAIYDRLDPTRPEQFRGLVPVVKTLHERRYGSTRRPLTLLFAAVGVLLLITCANLANLALARGVRRHREFSLRLALGAGRRRIARHVLLESLVLSIVGAGIGLALAAASIDFFVRVSPSAVGNVEGIGIDTRVLLFTLVVAVLTSLLFGSLPAASAARADLSQAMTAGGARSTGGNARLRRVLVVLELATALVLVVGAGLVARSFWSVTSIPAGFDARDLVTAEIELSPRIYGDTAARRYVEELLARVQVLPGVRSAALSDGLPLVGSRMSTTFHHEGQPTPQIDMVGVSAQYVETMGMRMVDGRALRPDEHASGAEVALVSAEVARTLWPGRSAVGERFGYNGTGPVIVGVTEDVRMRELEAAPSLVAFTPIEQGDAWNYLTLTIRTDPGASVAPLTQAVARITQDIDPKLAPPTLRPMADIVAEEVAPRKFVLILLALFAGLAGALAAVGLYGVLACFVAERTREIGIRAALGADRGTVLRFMMAQGAALTAGGLAFGVVAALAAVRVLESMVYGVGVHDVATFAGAAVALGVVAMVASVLPGVRASRVDPVIALRAD